MSPTEIAFLALGLVLGAAIGAAFVVAVRIHPAPRRQVRVTVTPHSIPARRSTTLASAEPSDTFAHTPGSPEAGAWDDDGAPESTERPLDRTVVLSGQPMGVSSRAVGVAVGPDPAGRPAPDPARATATTPQLGPRPSGPIRGGAPTSSPAEARSQGALRSTHGALALAAPVPALRRAEAVQTLVLERVAEDARPDDPANEARATLDVGRPADHAVRPRLPGVVAMPLRVPMNAVPVAVIGDGPAPRAASRTGRRPDHRAASGVVGAGELAPVATAEDQPAAAGSVLERATDTDSCAAERRLAAERCAFAAAAHQQARSAADTLREAQRAYDTLRERVERAEAAADPREIRAAKDAAHHAFRAARSVARDQDAAEAAARDWLHEINRINTAARDARLVIEGSGEELRAQQPKLERLAVEADAARIGAETAQAACREAQETLARCEEAALLASARSAAEREAATAAAAIHPLAPEPPGASGWPTEPEEPLIASLAAEPAGEPLPAILRALRGERAAREEIVTTLAGDDQAESRTWRMRLAGLFDAIIARAIEDGYLDLPDDDGFWALFTHTERRDVVGALSALGFRFDGMGSFADERVPAQRDLSLAVGYAGLDRMRIRHWPREEELAGLYQNARVAADEWLAGQAGDLSLGRMVDALGGRAGELAEVWNAWGRIRPALLATD